MLNELLNKIAKLPRVWSLILLVLFIIALYVLLQKGVTPFVMKVAESDFFFEKEDEQEELGKINNERSDVAYTHCRNVMKTDKKVPETAQFAEKDYEAWALGGRTYLIRSHVALSTPEKGMVDRKYACKIKFKGGDINDSNNWDMLAVDFNEPTEGG
ncbi:MAG: hypothetical protein PHE55_07540 [Methylococcaceae bacterium]|nr:hypothetical protein [Methylococcaceae bacterium]